MKFRITLKSFEKGRIQEACDQLKLSLMKTSCAVIGRVAMPTQIKKFCVLRSPHGDKDSREHFELRFHKTFIDIDAVSPLTLRLLAEIEMPYGVAASVSVIDVLERKCQEEKGQEEEEVYYSAPTEEEKEPWAVEHTPLKLGEIGGFNLDVNYVPTEYDTVEFEPQDDDEEFDEDF